MNESMTCRPKTKGELLSFLKEGKECEVVASHEEFTSICLDGWLGLDKFDGNNPIFYKFRMEVESESPIPYPEADGSEFELTIIKLS